MQSVISRTSYHGAVSGEHRLSAANMLLLFRPTAVKKDRETKSHHVPDSEHGLQHLLLLATVFLEHVPIKIVKGRL